MPDNKAVTPAQVAATYGCTVWFVQEQARRGRVPHLRLARGKVMFLPEQVEEFGRRLTVEPSPEPPRQAFIERTDVDLMTALGVTERSARRHRGSLGDDDGNPA